jgi:hypothetical protein
MQDERRAGPLRCSNLARTHGRGTALAEIVVNFAVREDQQEFLIHWLGRLAFRTVERGGAKIFELFHRLTVETGSLQFE